MNRKIIQIVPSVGWFALYLEDGSVRKDPLACWALVEDDDGFRHVIGMEATDFVSSAEDIGGFQGYAFGN